MPTPRAAEPIPPPTPPRSRAGLRVSPWPTPAEQETDAEEGDDESIDIAPPKRRTACAGAHAGTAEPCSRFVTHENVYQFDGLGSIQSNKTWWKKFRIVYGDWAPAEHAHTLYLYLEGQAEAWYIQLGRGVRKDWTALSSAFVHEFCTPTATALERYHTTRQRTGETVRQYLWRLNVAARAAKSPYSTTAGTRSHTTRFLRTLIDNEAKLMLRGCAFSSVSELEDVLKPLEEHIFNECQFEAETAGLKRPAQHGGKVYLAESDDLDGGRPSASHPHVRFREESNASEPSDKSGRLSDDEDWPTEVYQTVAAPSRIRPPPQPPCRDTRPGVAALPTPGRGPPSPKRNRNCYTCGKPGHFASECQVRVLCADYTFPSSNHEKFEVKL